MMETLIERADRIARAAQRKRLEQIAASIGGREFAVEIKADSIAIRGRRIVQKWLSDPLLRFAGRQEQ